MGLGSYIQQFFFNTDQKNRARGSHQEETPEDALWNVAPFNGAKELINTGGKWYEKDNSVPEENETSYTPIADSEIVGGYYIPRFRVAGVTVDSYPQTGDPLTAGYLINYDQPNAWNIQERMYAGQHYPRRITRVRLGAGTTATKIILHRN